MGIGKKLHDQAVTEIMSSLPKKTHKRQARKIAEKKLKKSIRDITAFYEDDTKVINATKTVVKFVRKNHTFLSVAILTSYPEMSEETAAAIVSELFTE